MGAIALTEVLIIAQWTSDHWLLQWSNYTIHQYTVPLFARSCINCGYTHMWATKRMPAYRYKYKSLVQSNLETT